MDTPNTKINRINELAPKGKPPARRWSIETKRRIVEESLVPGASVAAVARKYDANANMLFRWRREYRRGDHGPQGPGRTPDESPRFVEVGIIDGQGRLMPPGTVAETGGERSVTAPTPLTPNDAPSSRIKLELPGQIRLSFDAGIDPAALRRLIVVVKEFV